MERAANARDDGPRFHPFVVSTAQSQDCIGRLEILLHDKDAEVAFLFVPSSWGHGYAREAVGAMLEHFERSGVKRFWACVTRDNTPSLGLCRRLGFAPAEVPIDLELWTYDKGDVVLKLESAVNPFETS